MTDEPNFDELSDAADKGELTPNKLQDELNKYQKAMQQEYEIKNAATTDPADVAENTREFFRNNSGMCAAQIVWLAGNSTSDAVRANCSKYVIDHVLEDHDATGDPLKNLLNELTKTKVKTTAA